MEDFFKQKPEPWRRVPKEQEAFIKLLVEDKDFRFRAIDLVDQNWFDPFELRDIVRTIKDMYSEGREITYKSIYERIAPHYDISDISKEISLVIIKATFDECETGDCTKRISIDKWKEDFINRLIERRYI